MKQAYVELKSLKERWESLCNARPGETDFSSYGFGESNAKHFTQVFDRWLETLESAIAKTRPFMEAEDRIVEMGLSRLFRDMRTDVDNAHGNNFAWLFQNTVFPQRIAEAAALITSAIEKRVAIRKELLKSVESKLNDELISVQRAAPIAMEIVNSFEAIQENAKFLSESRTNAESAIKSLDEIKANVEASKNSISQLLENATVQSGEIGKLRTNVEATITSTGTEIATSLNDAKTKVDAAVLDGKSKLDAVLIESKTNVDSLLKEARLALDEVQRQKTSSDGAIKTGEELIRQATEKLSKALQDINRQALAGAFHSLSSKIGGERNIWFLAFTLSILALVVIALHNSDTGAAFDWRNLLRVLPFAAPIVWLGWFSARQLAILSRIQQDYEYKAATAVAFDGYKKEVLAANDEALAKQLLETAVKNFGENPIRLYDGRKDDHASPMEALVSHMQDDKLWPRFVDLLKALKPEFKK